MTIKRVLFLLLSVVLLSQHALAWGHVGHAVVADIAESRLTPEAANNMRELLAVEHYKHLSDISSWADMIKPEHLPGSPAHSIRLPLDHSTTIAPSACPFAYCAVQGINDYYKMLANKSLPLAQREVALKYLVHLVGDLHMPLHASKATGGNVAVIFDGKEQKLHKVWDTSIITDHDRNPETLAKKLNAAADKSGLYFGGDATSWALESRDIARDKIYNQLPTKSAEAIRLPADYDRLHWPIIEARLTQAGVRLANLLNSALK